MQSATITSSTIGPGERTPEPTSLALKIAKSLSSNRPAMELTAERTLVSSESYLPMPPASVGTGHNFSSKSIFLSPQPTMKEKLQTLKKYSPYAVVSPIKIDPLKNVVFQERTLIDEVYQPKFKNKFVNNDLKEKIKANHKASLLKREASKERIAKEERREFLGMTGVRKELEDGLW